MRWMLFILISCLMGLSGCGGPTASKDTVVLGNKPPVAQITIGGETIEAVQGSYCWSYKSSGVCVDKISYDELVTEQEVHLKAKSGDLAEIEFAVAPDELSVMASFPGNERPDEALSVENSRFHLAAGTGKHLYVIHARWSQGSSSYVFEVENKM